MFGEGFFKEVAGWHKDQGVIPSYLLDIFWCVSLDKVLNMATPEYVSSERWSQ